MTTKLDVVVIGAGQAGLAAGYYLAHTSLSFLTLDKSPIAGGSWRHAWGSLRAFSPAEASSLPGWAMPRLVSKVYPSRDDVVAYLAAYEKRYGHVERGIKVLSVEKESDVMLRVNVEDGRVFRARAVVSATGTFGSPFTPDDIPGTFKGRVLHSSEYSNPTEFRGKKVIVVGAGNSGAQIFVDLLQSAENVTWVTKDEPRFLPDDVDGRVLFLQGTEMFHMMQINDGRPLPDFSSEGNIVMTGPVKRARDDGLLNRKGMFARFTPDNMVQWPDGSEEQVDAIIYATGFRPNVSHLAPLVVPDESGRIEMKGVHAAVHLRLFPLGYGAWTGYASATIVGVGRAAKQVVHEIEENLKKQDKPV